ncbi:hypothetical protein EST38_g13996 [Candolleomyces aberdarensis]|uniref:Uncharacterized protein n=1 Tax=Candolleomyces aberdarensis TaxID=2316362 RepID=A0A4Q2CZD9_9AGAR|nr:hypothetical protein EST38_g13996 [Candolleomyces aberdarensis]
MGSIHYRETLDYKLCFAFAIIAQLVLWIADGLLVYRCYLIFIDRRAVYVPVIAIYTICIMVSMIEAYPALEVRGYPDLPDSGSHLEQAAEYELLILWFTTSLMTNILVTGFIISRIFHRLSLAASYTRAA